ncbi:hypothetical protein QJS10_CPB21g01730 [Acorus calamus]|uniref:Reverse transcriptase zinc-binding domain-containing protein n=1 Tax=Acorus calamus TaxID=4465 RepID=A0AAV9C7A7_ACOCL|nr:hypothetical protein QJS10_CPB21g01730 [Acorus calamus]
MGVRFWEIATNHPSLWAQWIQKRYLKKCSLWEVRPTCSSTTVWRKILKAGEWIRPKTHYVIFDDHTINLWFDPWLRGYGLAYHFHGQPLLCWGPPKYTTVSKFIIDGQWRKPSRWPIDLDSLWEEISELDVGGVGPDILIWKGAKTGRITYKTAWTFTRSRGSLVPWARELWHPIQPPRRSFLCWQAGLNKLPTLHRLLGI